MSQDQRNWLDTATASQVTAAVRKMMKQDPIPWKQLKEVCTYWNQQHPRITMDTLRQANLI